MRSQTQKLTAAKLDSTRKNEIDHPLVGKVGFLRLIFNTTKEGTSVYAVDLAVLSICATIRAITVARFEIGD